MSLELDLPVENSLDGEAYVEFYPDGRCDAGTIQLTGGQGEVYQVTCLSASEQFEIVQPEENDRL